MDIANRLNKFEELKTDKQMALLLEGVRVIIQTPEFSADSMEKYKSKKNQMVNNKLTEYHEDFTDKFDSFSEPFYAGVQATLAEFCDFGEDDYFADVLFEFGNDRLTLDGMVEVLKTYTIALSKTPEGHHMVISHEDGSITYVPETNL